MLGDELKPSAQLPSGAGLGQGFVTRGTPRAGATPRAQCGPGSRPEGELAGPRARRQRRRLHLQSRAARPRGRATGGFKVERYVDAAGHECAYYDTALVFPTNAPYAAAQTPGIAVLDMTDPAKPVRTDTLVTPAMQSPHESLLVNSKRGLLAAVMGNPSTYPGIVDLYDVNAGLPRSRSCCRRCRSACSATRAASRPTATRSGRRSLFNGSLTAVDVTDPRVPVTLCVGLLQLARPVDLRRRQPRLPVAAGRRPDDPRRLRDPGAQAQPAGARRQPADAGRS